MTILFVLSITALCCESLRILQNASYKLNRGYFKVFTTWYYLLIICVQIVVIALRLSVLITSVLTLFVAIATLISNKKVKLKFTKRIVRIMLFLIGVVLIFACFVGYKYIIWAVPLFVVIAWALSLPIDLTINNYYLYKAINKLDNSSITVIAVVGSYGKTSVKDMIGTILDDCIYCKGSCNTPLGIAKFINNTDLSAKYLVLEFGARNVGDIAELCRYFKPKYAVVTGVCGQHLEYFKTLDNVIKTKREVVDYLPNDGICVLNCNDKYAVSYRKYGVCSKVLSCDNLCVTTSNVGFNGSDLSICYDNRTYNVRLPHISNYVCDNLQMAIQLSIQLKQSITLTVKNIGKIAQTPHRMELAYNGKFYILDDSYNGSIAGVQSCCDTLLKFNCSKVCITQGLVECGKSRYELNVECGRLLGNCCDVVIVLGKNAKYLSYGVAETGSVLFTAHNLKQAVKIATNYVDDGILLFQNDLPDIVNV